MPFFLSNVLLMSFQCPSNGQSCPSNAQWLGLARAVYDRIIHGIPAKITVNTPYIYYGYGQPYHYIITTRGRVYIERLCVRRINDLEGDLFLLFQCMVAQLPLVPCPVCAAGEPQERDPGGLACLLLSRFSRNGHSIAACIFPGVCCRLTPRRRSWSACSLT